MERLGKRFPVNPNSSGNISFSEPGLILSMNVRYDIDKGVLQFDQSHAIEHLAKRLGLTESAPRTLPIPHDFNLPKLKEAEVDVNQYLSVLGSILEYFILRKFRGLMLASPVELCRGTPRHQELRTMKRRWI